MAVAEPVVITTSEARKGTERTLTFPDTGKQIVLTIPKGIRDGQQIRIVYYGNTFLIPIQVIEDPDKKSLKETLFSLPLIGLWICFCLFLLFYVIALRIHHHQRLLHRRQRVRRQSAEVQPHPFPRKRRPQREVLDRRPEHATGSTD